MTSTGGMTTTWDAENRPTSIYRVSGSETYVYDADGERINRTAGYTTTVFLGGLWQEDVASGAVGLTRVLYGFNGASVAQRTHVTSPSSDSVVYLHGDHLGSVSVVSGWNGSATTLVSSQRFDPWGKVIAGGNVTQTRSNYTGQELDTTGLLYYHARYYDPNLGRFMSADTIVPGTASGGMDGLQLRPLTVDFHEPGFAAQLGGENGQAFWFQLSDDEREKAGIPWGPANPQALNRYSYVQNNPLGATDPNGHKDVLIDANKKDDLGQTELDRLTTNVNNTFNQFWIDSGGFTLLAGAAAAVVTTPVGGLIAMGAVGATVTVVLRDLNRVLGMLQDAQKFLNANGGGKVRITNVGGNIAIEAASNNRSVNGYNYFKQTTKVVQATSMMLDKILNDTFPSRYG